MWDLITFSLFNLRRHENEYCPLKIEDREVSESTLTMLKTMLQSCCSESSLTTDNAMETEGKNDF